MKLLVVSHPCAVPINQQFYATVAEQTGWDLSIAGPSNWKNEYGEVLSLDRWQHYKGKLTDVPVWLSGNIPLHVYRSTFLRLFREVRPDAVYMHHEPYAAATFQVLLASRMAGGLPFGFYSAQNILKNYPPPFRWMESAVFRASSYAFPVSQSVESVMREKGYSGPSIVLPLGINPDLYVPRPDDATLRASLLRGEEGVLIGYVGRITKEKGLHTLLQALSLIRDLPWRLVVVGNGDYEEEFDSQASALNLSDRVQRQGFVPHAEAPRYFSAFDLFVLPSETQPNWKEQFGRVVIEALACGTPVLGSDSGEIPYLIEATKGGLVFPERNPEAFAAQLRRMILDRTLREEAAREGRARVLAGYTEPVLAERFAQSIEDGVRAHRA